MASSPSRRSILALYKNLLRESEKFPNYNFRNYALRKVRDSFRANQKVTDKKERIAQYNSGLDNLDVIRRQIIVGSLYKTENLVIENEGLRKTTQAIKRRRKFLKRVLVAVEVDGRKKKQKKLHNKCRKS